MHSLFILFFSIGHKGIKMFVYVCADKYRWGLYLTKRIRNKRIEGLWVLLQLTVGHCAAFGVERARTEIVTSVLLGHNRACIIG